MSLPELSDFSIALDEVVDVHTRLALFDLDGTLLSGDSDVLWCEYLVAQGVLGAAFEARNAELDRRYRLGQVTAAEFSSFYAGTLAGRSAADWQPLRDGFMREVIRPRLPAAAHDLVRTHRATGETVLLTTASNRFLVKETAAALGFEHLLATDLGVDLQGHFTGATDGTLNMREGKVTRLRKWLRTHGLSEDDSAVVLAHATFYSDSINDLALLQAVGKPVVVDPDPKLARVAAERDWPVLALAR